MLLKITNCQKSSQESNSPHPRVRADISFNIPNIKPEFPIWFPFEQRMILYTIDTEIKAKQTIIFPN